MLENYIRNQLKKKDILLMTHIVLGYPSFEDSLKIVETMVEAGVDMIELQIPFSEPIADGPVILHANQIALKNGATLKKSFDIAGQIANRFDIPFLFMSYYNILFKYTEKRFISKMKDLGLKGMIVPDLPPEEAGGYINIMKQHHLDPIFIYSPTTPEARMKKINSVASGFIYCVARKGVTGADTQFSKTLTNYIHLCRKSTNLPLAVGFGIKNKEDINFLKGKVDIAVIGSQTIRIIDQNGINGLSKFITHLR